MKWLNSLLKRRNPNLAHKPMSYLEKISEQHEIYIKYFTKELIEWIGQTNDPIMLACAAHNLNCGIWPTYLPAKPDWYDTYAHEGIQLSFIVMLYNHLKTKSDTISPRLEHIIWINHYFQDYQP